MDNLFDHIKDSVNKSFEVESSDKAWETFVKFRNGKGRDKLPLGWFVAMGLTALLIGSNIFWSTRSIVQISDNTITIHDTIYVTQSINKSNKNDLATITSLQDKLDLHKELLTSYNEKYKHLYSKYSSQLEFFTFLENKLKSSFENQSYMEFISESEGGAQELGLKDNKVITNHENLLFQNGLLANTEIEFLYYKNSYNLIYPKPLIWNAKQSKKGLWNILKPKSFSVFASGGFSSGISSQLRSGQSYSLGFTSLLSHRFRVLVYGSTTVLEGELNNINDPSIPEITVAEDDELIEVKLKSNATAISLDIEYLFQPINRWRPYVGIGYSRLISTKEQYEYEIDSPNGNYYLSPEYKTEVEHANQLLFTIGSDINFLDRFDLRLASKYNYNIGNIYPSFLTFSGGVYYHF